MTTFTHDEVDDGDLDFGFHETDLEVEAWIDEEFARLSAADLGDNLTTVLGATS